MSFTGSRLLFSVVAFIGFSLAAGSAQAQTRAETLRYVTGASVNTLDPNIPGSTRESFAVSLSTYDRLVSFGRKQLNGKWVFDLDKITGELAESYDVSPDGLKIVFHLRKDAKFQDGTPVTAEDVKWSLDRVVTAPVLGKAQLLTGSMTSADQFKVIDPLTFEVTLPKPDKLALPNFATVYPMAEGAHGRQRRLSDRNLQAGRTGDHDAQRSLESWNGRKVSVLQEGHHTVCAGTGDARQFGRAR
jgi:peptide/nickel transport system substrate-binding protein